MTTYYIPDHVHFAIEGDKAVFLDLRMDKYSMLVGSDAHAFRSLLSHTPLGIRRVISLEAETNNNQTHDHATLLSELLNNHILLTHTDQEPLPLPTHIPLPEKILVDPSFSDASGIRMRDVWQFFASCFIARWQLNFAKIENIAAGVKRRSDAGNARAMLDIREARKLVRMYNRLRPLFPQDYTCLFDSLSLLEFLARHGCFPTWVFAVQLEPWRAHCWVQHGGVAFNEDSDVAQSYLPIMAL